MTETDSIPRRSRVHRLLALLAAALVLLDTGAAGAAPTTERCLVQKRQTWAALRKCQAVEESRLLKGKPADLAKCQTSFEEKLARITAKATAAGIACRLRDNGDLTVTDFDSGLMWEKKTGGTGLLCLPNDVHCVSDTHTLPEAHSFVARLSGTTDANTNPTLISGVFAGHSDWRLPTIKELQTIRPITVPTDPIFGPTGDDCYWSSTISTSSPDAAFGVLVEFRSSCLRFASTSLYVRAVRNGM